VWALWRAARGRFAPVAVVLAGLMLPLAYGRAIDVAVRFRTPMRPVEGVPFLTGMQATPADAEAYELANQVITAFIRGRPATPMVVLGQDALLATFVPDRRNWRPYFVSWPGLPDPTDAERRRYLATYHPIVLLGHGSTVRASTLEHEDGYRVLDRGPLGVMMVPAASGLRIGSAG
jgi:hypothetical protein